MSYRVKYYRHGKVVTWPHRPRNVKRPSERVEVPVRCAIEQLDRLGETDLLYVSHEWHGDHVKSVKKTPNGRPRIDGFRRSIPNAAKDAIRSRLAMAFESRFRRGRICLFYTFSVPHALNGRKAQEDHPRILKQFQKLLENLRKRHGLLDYTWVSEAQENGQVHFHCIFFQSSQHFLRVSHVNFYWCRLLMEIGIDCIQPLKRRELILQSSEHLGMALARGSAAFLHWIRGQSPFDGGFDRRILDAVYPCVDAKRVKTMRGMSQYLSKYVSKKESGKPPVYCCRWYMSKRLVALKGFVVVDDGLDRVESYSEWTHLHQWGERDDQWVRVDHIDQQIYCSSQFSDIYGEFGKLIRLASSA